MTKSEAIKLFNEGKAIRLTKGNWNYPERDGKIAKSVEEIERFYSWASAVTVLKNNDNIVDLRGASHCDMY